MNFYLFIISFGDKKTDISLKKSDKICNVWITIACNYSYNIKYTFGKERVYLFV